MQRKTLLGLLGVLGIWLTAGFALPLVNVLDIFTPTQLMVFRGFLTALMAFIGLRGVIRPVDKRLYLLAIVLPLATLGLFQDIRHWGAGPTIIIITATPLVNLLIGAFLGRRVTLAGIVGLALVLGGVIMAQEVEHFQWTGFAWSVFGTIMNGILYELFARAGNIPALQKCFWTCLGMGVLGLALSFQESWAPIMEPGTAGLVLTFAFIGGFLYWLSNVIAFEKLPTTEASVLAQGETPFVILGAYFLLNENLTLVQGLGVAIALCGAGSLAYWLSKQKDPKQTTSE